MLVGQYIGTDRRDGAVIVRRWTREWSQTRGSHVLPALAVESAVRAMLRAQGRDEAEYHAVLASLPVVIPATVVEKRWTLRTRTVEETQARMAGWKADAKVLRELHKQARDL